MRMASMRIGRWLAQNLPDGIARRGAGEHASHFRALSGSAADG
jgi:hypothetical protein